MLPRSRTHGRDEKGSISVWMITTALTMTLLVGLAVDLGGQVYAKQRAQDLAAQAARSGGQQLVASSSVRGVNARVDPAAALAAARTYIAGAPGYSGSARVTGGTTVIADTLAGVRAEAGDVLIPQQEGAIGPDHVRAELGQVLLGQAPGRTAADEITAFESVGAAFEDAVTARLAYERALARGLGTRFAFW